MRYRECKFDLGGGYFCKDVVRFPVVVRWISWVGLLERPVVFVAMCGAARVMPGFDWRRAVALLVLCTAMYQFAGVSVLGSGVLSAVEDVLVSWMVASFAVDVFGVRKKVVLFWANVWTIVWIFVPVTGTFFWLCVGLLWFGGTWLVGVKRRDESVEKERSGKRMLCFNEFALGGLCVDEVLRGELNSLWCVVSTNDEWPTVKMDALMGDHYMKLLLDSYVRELGGSVRDQSVLEQSLLTDRALISFARENKVSWWDSTEVSMHGKPAATLVEASWGLLWRNNQSFEVDGELQALAVKERFPVFLGRVASANGLALDGLKCVRLVLNEVESVSDVSGN